MDCHEFARLCFTNSHNDKIRVIFIDFIILINLVIPTHLVILSAAKYP